MSQLVLIVDDSVPMQHLIKAHLDEQGLQFLSAFDGFSAITYATATKPDLVLLDVDLPDMNGFEVCRALKSDPETSDIPVVFLTAASSADEKICGLDLRAIDYITKPFEPGELCARVRAALRSKRLLDLLPKQTPRQTKGKAAFGLEPGQSLNERISLSQLMQVRSANPWHRKPPS